MANKTYTFNLSSIAVSVLGHGDVKGSARKVLGTDRQQVIAEVLKTFGKTAIFRHANLIEKGQQACRALKAAETAREKKAARADYDKTRAKIEKAFGDNFSWNQHWQGIGWVSQTRRVQVDE